jgi:hypothetical protein
MATIQQHVLRWLVLASPVVLIVTAQVTSDGTRALVSVGKIQRQKISELQEFSIPWGTSRESKAKHVALNVGSDGEVSDSPWYQNRHARRRMSVEELVRGPGNGTPPAQGPWRIVSAKTEGVTPGFLIEDSAGAKYLLKFDPPAYPELASGADVVVSKFFYALGYHVPENYIVRFDRDRLIVDPQSKQAKNIRKKDVDAAFARMRRDVTGQYRALASRILAGEPVGPFLYRGKRSDDPNDTIPHEDRRELRGLYVFAAWLNHTDAKSGNTLDMVATENGVRFVKHYLIDFGSALGSAAHERKSPRHGHEYVVDIKPAAAQLFTLGLYVPKWARMEYSDLHAVGSFEAEAFVPDNWKPTLPNPAFNSRQQADCAWAARKVSAFRDEEIRAIVQTGEYTDAEAVNWISKTLTARRDKISASYLGKNPLPTRTGTGTDR